MHLTFTYWQVGLVVAIVMLPSTALKYKYKSIKSLFEFNIILFILRFIFWPIQIIESMLEIARIQLKKEYKDDEEE